MIFQDGWGKIEKHTLKDIFQSSALEGLENKSTPIKHNLILCSRIYEKAYFRKSILNLETI